MAIQTQRYDVFLNPQSTMGPGNVMRIGGRKIRTANDAFMMIPLPHDFLYFF